MSNLKHWQDKIKEKRKQTSWDDFIKEIASWFPLMMNKSENLISVFPESPRSGKICDKQTYINKYSDTLVSKDYLEGSFFESFEKLFKDMYKPSVLHFGNNENSSFAHCIFGASNVYLSFVVGDDCENVMYSSVVYVHCNNVFHSVGVHHNCDNIYGCKGISESLNVLYSLNIHNSSNIINSSNLMGCHDCIDCDDLINKSYHYKNKSYGREEFKKIKEKYKIKSSFGEKKGINFSSENVLGEGIFHSNNVHIGYYANRLNNGNKIMYIGGGKLSENFIDTFEAGIDSKDFYGVCNAGTNSSNLYCSSLIDNGSANIYYSYFMDACSFCLGCVGLKNKSYCILNKQYTKEEWYEKIDEIFSNMESSGDLGKFFPGSMNPFNFNDTAAGLVGNFTKEEAEADGYMWRDEEIKVDIPEGAKVITTDELDKYQAYDSDGNWKINPEILKVVIKDKSGNYYKIIKMEYDFLVKHSLPLPEIHWMDRMKLNFGM